MITTNYPLLTRQTERLTLRPPIESDAEQITMLAGNFAVSSMVGRIPYPYSQADAEDFIHYTEKERVTGKGFVFALVDHGLIGMIGLDDVTDDGAELGYWIGEPFWGKGFASEAAESVVAFGFNEVHLKQIRAAHFVENNRSRRVLEKMGFKTVGDPISHPCAARKESVTAQRLVLSRTDWEAHNKTAPS